MAQHPCDLRQSGIREGVRRGCRYCAGDKSPSAVVDDKARDCEARPRSDRGNLGLGEGLRLSGRREPARFRGHLKHLLAEVPEVRRVKHHAALPYDEIATFIADLRERPGIAARALEFTILTAARTGEVIGARWDEITLKSKVWTVPAERMKASREHRVPLTEPAVAVLEQIHRPSAERVRVPWGSSGHDEQHGDGDAPATNGPHYYCAWVSITFRDWAAERTGFPSEVAEAALAHVVGDKVEAAYRRGDLFEKRRMLMEAWAEYCAGRPAGGVVALPMRDAS